MNFGRIISRSFNITWRYKSLWLFGLFSGYSSNFNINVGCDPHDLLGLTVDFNPDHLWELLGPLLIALGLLALLFLALHCIALPALIDGVNRIARGGVYRFDASLSRGIDFFLRILGLFVLAVVVAAGGVIVLAAIAATIVGLIVAIPAGLFGFFAFLSIFSLADRALVVRDCSVGDALSEGYLLFRRHMSDCLIILLIFIGLGIAIGIAVAIVGILAYWPINAVVTALTYKGVWILLLSILLGLPVSLVLSGLAGTFLATLYTLFYFELVEPTPAPVAAGPGPGLSGPIGQPATPPPTGSPPEAP